MTDSFKFLILPGLRPRPEDAGARLDPGFLDYPPPGAYRPDYPLSPGAAREKLEAISLRDLTGLEVARHGFEPFAERDKAKLAKELSDIASFAGANPSQPNADQIFERAQEWLLWIWRMEEEALEIAALEAKCLGIDLALAGNFGEGQARTEDIRSRPDPALAPPWRVCVKNAMHFCPPELPILAEGAMAADLRDFLEFEPAEAVRPDLGDAFLINLSPLWKILGQSGPVEPESGKAEIFNSRRVWLVRKDEE
ncbi:MAG: hypothetical protein K2H64_05660 [Desulfovibrio sp.]|nr:hypothetical protein [Desulfovibrio sp.]